MKRFNWLIAVQLVFYTTIFHCSNIESFLLLNSKTSISSQCEIKIMKDSKLASQKENVDDLIVENDNRKNQKSVPSIIHSSFYKIQDMVESIPPMILSNVPGTWAFDTMSRRIRDEILSRIYDENNLHSTEDQALKIAKERLDRIQHDLQESNIISNLKMTSVGKPSDIDYETWQTIIAPYENVKWLDCPWLITEFYFYRQIVDAFQYFDTLYDPFHFQKFSGLQSSIPLTIELFQKYSSIPDEKTTGKLRFAIFGSLWGNKMDLSLWPTKSNEGDANTAETISSVLEANSENLLCDDYSTLENHLLASDKEHKRVDIVVDNAGFELMTDILLANALIDTNAAQEIIFHVKGHPTFVSDALENDLRETISELRAHGLTKANDWESYLDTGVWKIRPDCYWAQPFPFWEIPTEIYEDFKANSHLAFLKGDANYRRLLGDRTWELTTPFQNIAGSFPSAICALRTLKAELGCGMEEKAVLKAKTRNPEDWMVTGKYGVLQFTTPV